MLFVAVQGRAAEAELLLEVIQGVAGQQGQVDVMGLGMVADGAFHGIPPESVASGQWSGVS